MTDQEREIVLKMIEDGKISPEEGLKLMNALKSSTDVEKPAAQPDATSVSAGKPEVDSGGVKVEHSGMAADPRIARVKSTVQRLWQVPLWIGIGITLLSALGMYFIMRGPGMNFWFFCLTLPLLLGIVVMVAGVGSRKARWIFVDVQQKPGERPGRIFLGLPLPLKLTAWFLRTFKGRIPGMDEKLKHTNTDEIIEAIESGLSGDEPLIVNVDEGEDGERVKVYIG
jgi:hypothetical protein